MFTSKQSANAYRTYAVRFCSKILSRFSSRCLYESPRRSSPLGAAACSCTCGEAILSQSRHAFQDGLASSGRDSDPRMVYITSTDQTLHDASSKFFTKSSRRTPPLTKFTTMPFLKLPATDCVRSSTISVPKKGLQESRVPGGNHA